MKKKQLIMGLVALIFLLTGLILNREGLAERKAAKEAEAASKEFHEKLRDKRDLDEVLYYTVRSDDEAIDYIEIKGQDKDEKIKIEGSFGQGSDNIISITDGSELIYINIADDKYYNEGLGFKMNPREKREGDDVAYLVEKTPRGYKLTDPADSRLVKTYDQDANLLEEVDFINGKFVKRSLYMQRTDVEGIYHHYRYMIGYMLEVLDKEKLTVK